MEPRFGNRQPREQPYNDSNQDLLTNIVNPSIKRGLRVSVINGRLSGPVMQNPSVERVKSDLQKEQEKLFNFHRDKDTKRVNSISFNDKVYNPKFADLWKQQLHVQRPKIHHPLLTQTMKDEKETIMKIRKELTLNLSEGCPEKLKDFGKKRRKKAVKQEQGAVVAY